MATHRLSYEPQAIHGHRPGSGYSPTYISWKGMRARCLQAKRDSAAHYYERGITHDPRWESFTAFLEDMGERPEGCTLDRIDNNKGYSKDNCRWATVLEQNRNRSVARPPFTHDGRTQSVAEWAAEFGVNYSTMRRRILRRNTVVPMHGNRTS